MYTILFIQATQERSGYRKFERTAQQECKRQRDTHEQRRQEFTSEKIARAKWGRNQLTVGNSRAQTPARQLTTGSFTRTISVAVISQWSVGMHRGLMV
jgi:hypothetical protein